MMSRQFSHKLKKAEFNFKSRIILIFRIRMLLLKSIKKKVFIYLYVFKLIKALSKVTIKIRKQKWNIIGKKIKKKGKINFIKIYKHTKKYKVLFNLTKIKKRLLLSVKEEIVILDFYLNTTKKLITVHTIILKNRFKKFIPFTTLSRLFVIKMIKSKKKYSKCWWAIVESI